MSSNQQEVLPLQFTKAIAEVTVAQFAEKMFASPAGLDPWAKMKIADAAVVPTFWAQALRLHILPPELASVLVSNPAATQALAKALQEPDIVAEGLVPPHDVEENVARGAYCVLIGPQPPEDDDERTPEEVAWWEFIAIFAASREEAVETVNLARPEGESYRPRVVADEAQLRGLAIELRRVSVAQIKPTNPDCFY